MSRIEDVARRREDWQKARAGLPWGEKIRMAARLRDAALALRRGKVKENLARQTPTGT